MGPTKIAASDTEMSNIRAERVEQYIMKKQHIMHRCIGEILSSQEVRKGVRYVDKNKGQD